MFPRYFLDFFSNFLCDVRIGLFFLVLMRAAAEDLEDAPVAKRQAVHVNQDYQRKIRLVRAGRALEEHISIPDVRTLILSYANEFDGVAIMTREQPHADTHVARAVLTVWMGCLVSTAHHHVTVWDLDTRAPKLELVGHTDRIRAAAVLQNDQLASGSLDHTVRLWRHDGSCTFVLVGHSSPVHSLVALDTGNVVSMSDDGSMRVWDTTGGTCVFQLAYPSGFNLIIGLPRGLIASASSGGAFVSVVDSASKTKIRTFAGRWIRCFAVLPDGRLAAGSLSGAVRLYDIAKNICSTLSAVHEINALAVVGTLLASGEYGGVIRLWNTDNFSCVFTLDGHTRSIYALACLPDGRLVSAAGDDIRVWNVATRQCELIVKTRCAIGKLAVLPDCKLAGLSELSFSGTRVHVWA